MFLIFSYFSFVDGFKEMLHWTWPTTGRVFHLGFLLVRFRDHMGPVLGERSSLKHSPERNVEVASSMYDEFYGEL